MEERSQRAGGRGREGIESGGVWEPRLSVKADVTVGRGGGRGGGRPEPEMHPRAPEGAGHAYVEALTLLPQQHHEQQQHKIHRAEVSAQPSRIHGFVMGLLTGLPR